MHPGEYHVCEGILLSTCHKYILKTDLLVYQFQFGAENKIIVIMQHHFTKVFDKPVSLLILEAEMSLQ